MKKKKKRSARKADVAAIRVRVDAVRAVLQSRMDEETRTLEGALSSPPPGVHPIQWVIVGGGFAATTAYVTRVLAGVASEKCALLAWKPEPWAALGEWQMGQPAAELVSEVFPHQPATCDDSNALFCPALAFASALAIAQHDHSVPLRRAQVRAVIQSSDRTFQVALEAGTLKATRVDIASGRGPASVLDENILSVPLAADLERSGHLVLGDGLATFTPRARVLVAGGGATGAWFAEKAAREGSEVTWLARNREAAAWEISLGPRLKRLQAMLHTSPRKVNRAKLERWLERLRGFRLADVPRNRMVFRDPKVKRLLGAINHIGVDGNSLRVGWTAPAGSAEFDQLVLAFGQEPRNPPGPVALADHIKGVGPITRDVVSGAVACPTSFRDLKACSTHRIIGVGTAAQTFRVLGAAAADPWKFLELGDEERFNLETIYAHQLDYAPRHSKGIAGSIYQASIDIALANGLSLAAALGKERLLHANLSRRNES